MGARMILTGSLAALIACSGGKDFYVQKCPDGRSVNVTKNCAASSASYVRTKSATVTQSLSAFDSLESEITVELQGQIAQLTGQMDQLTLQYETSLKSLCATQQSDPCDSEQNAKLTDGRLEMVDQFLAARTGVETALAAATSGDSQGAADALVDATVALGGVEPVAPAAVTGAVEDAADEGAAAVEEAADGAEDAVEEAADGADEAVEEAADGAEDAVEGAEDAAEEAVAPVGGLPGPDLPGGK